MNVEAERWLEYARDNYAAAEWRLESGRLNPCLQNAQQTVEKALKALIAHRQYPLKRTHSIKMLNQDLLATGVDVGLTAEDCELFDSIYIDSKYPMPSVIPHGPPEINICRSCTELARRTLQTAEQMAQAT